MPEELRAARLLASERRFRCERPVALSGAPDQVYRLADGRVVVVDTKRRPRAAVYEADVAQLSIYRVLLGAQKAYRDQEIAGYGYVRLATAEGVVYRRVELWDRDRVVALHRRYWALREGRTPAAGAPAAGLCRRCGHRGAARRRGPEPPPNAGFGDGPCIPFILTPPDFGCRLRWPCFARSVSASSVDGRPTSPLLSKPVTPMLRGWPSGAPPVRPPRFRGPAQDADLRFERSPDGEGLVGGQHGLAVAAGRLSERPRSPGRARSAGERGRR